MVPLSDVSINSKAASKEERTKKELVSLGPAFDVVSTIESEYCLLVSQHYVPSFGIFP
jgi:hypothetical protein